MPPPAFTTMIPAVPVPTNLSMVRKRLIKSRYNYAPIIPRLFAGLNCPRTKVNASTFDVISCKTQEYKQADDADKPVNGAASREYSQPTEPKHR